MWRPCGAPWGAFGCYVAPFRCTLGCPGCFDCFRNVDSVAQDWPKINQSPPQELPANPVRVNGIKDRVPKSPVTRNPTRKHNFYRHAVRAKWPEMACILACGRSVFACLCAAKALSCTKPGPVATLSAAKGIPRGAPRRVFRI